MKKLFVLLLMVGFVASCTAPASKEKEDTKTVEEAPAETPAAEDTTAVASDSSEVSLDSVANEVIDEIVDEVAN